MVRISTSSAIHLWRKVCFTIRSSSEWNDITTTTPPGRRHLIAAISPSLRALSSSFTAILRAWKVRVAGWIR